MADQNTKIYLMGIKFGTQRFLGSLITSPSEVPNFKPIVSQGIMYASKHGIYRILSFSIHFIYSLYSCKKERDNK